MRRHRGQRQSDRYSVGGDEDVGRRAGGVRLAEAHERSARADVAASRRYRESKTANALA